MATSAIFTQRQPGGLRVSVIVERFARLDLFEEALPRAGYHLQSVEAGMDTACDIAAGHPDLVILEARSRSSIVRLAPLLATVRSHPRLRRVPVLLCMPRRLQPIPMAPPELATVRIMDAPIRGDTLGEVIGSLVRTGAAA